jgi:hypothetical protein
MGFNSGLKGLIFVTYESLLEGCRLSLKCDGTRADTRFRLSAKRTSPFNPLNAELNPICHLLSLLGAHHILHIGGIRVKSAGGVTSVDYWQLRCAHQR